MSPEIGILPLPEPPYDGDRPRVDGSLALKPFIWGPSGAQPDERRLRLFGQALAEVLSGRRPAENLADRFTDRAYHELLHAGRMLETERPPFVGVPHVNEPRDGAIEMCLLVHGGDRSRVLAVRLERRGVQWVCTDFETA
ncbi:Rv3235 family protein [Nonomuraea sp. NPDC050790]|uniref:Rv3235 family protein n=1 Tax=Nonomuraea sp. NPDC050790 TaxID=3364371 RepID=UPI0037BADA53